MIYRKFFKLLVATLLSSFMFMSCGKGTEPTCDNFFSDGSLSKVPEVPSLGNLPGGISLSIGDSIGDISGNFSANLFGSGKLDASEFSKCLDEKNDISKAFDEVSGMIREYSSTLEIGEFAEKLATAVPSLKITFNSDDYEFSNFLSEGIRVIKKAYPDAAEDALNKVLQKYAKDVKEDFPKVGNLDSPNDFIKAGITNVANLQDLFPTTTLRAFLSAGLTLSDFVSAGYSLSDLEEQFVGLGLEVGDYIRAGITNIEKLKSVFPAADASDSDYDANLVLAVRVLGEDRATLLASLAAIGTSSFSDTRLDFFLLILFPKVTYAVDPDGSTSTDKVFSISDDDLTKVKSLFFGSDAPTLVATNLADWKILLKAFYNIKGTDTDATDAIARLDALMITESAPLTREQVTEAIGVEDDFILKVMFEDADADADADADEEESN